METSNATIKVITTPYSSVSRRLAQKLVADANLSPGDTIEINARHTDLVTDSFTEELVIALFKENFVSKVGVRGTLPGMFSGIKAHADRGGFVNRVVSIPLSQR